MSIKKVMCYCLEHGVLVEMKNGSALGWSVRPGRMRDLETSTHL